MIHACISRAVLLGIALALTACTASRQPVTAVAELDVPGVVELSDTPFFAQQDYQCGPAALATVLSSASVEVTPEDLAPMVYLPGRHGTLQAELLAAVRRHSRIPYVLLPSLDALFAEVAAGRPVLVLQKLGIGPFPAWHYAVVIGYDTTAELVLLRSGTDARLVMPVDHFLAGWNRADRWAMAVLNPGEVPAKADLNHYMKAAAGLEEVGQINSALLAYEAAVRHWPDAVLPRLGLANLAYQQGQLAAAELGYRDAIERGPGDVVARNNHAEVLLKLGCTREAADEIEVARVLADGGPFAGVVDSSADRIAAVALKDNVSVCPVVFEPAARVSLSR